uniref:P-type Cu(+) transporter n=1 Tax=Plectus sambesii TaxID=2011161 RepID=A0A914V032_9BILA
VKRDAKKSGRSGKDGGKDQFEESQPKALSEDEEEEKPKKRKKSNSSTSSSSSSLSDSSDNKKSKSKKEKKKKEKSKKEKSKKAKDSKKGGRKQTEQMSMETSTHKQFSGSPSEVALLRYAAHLVDLKFMRSQYETIFEIPFNSLRKWHLVIAKLPDEGKKGKASFIVMMKGAVEKLIEMCSTYALNGEEEEIDDEFRSDCDEMNYHFGSEGRRVIGFVYKKFEARADTKFTQEEENYPLEDLCFLGMAAIMDPPRDDTAKAIKACKAAGIKVFMVTGDHPITASAIARQIGLIGKADEVKHSHRKIQMNVTEEEDNDSAIVHGETLLDLNDEQWDELLSKRDIVFARTTPELKLLIVEQCQKRGEIVAATGDGVNDAPAL